MKRARGFTLLELLTVIAIIAILSAILLPVFARAKLNAQRASDISGLNEIRSALQLYRTDQGGYPPALLGYETLYTANNNVVPANQIAGFLFPKRVNNLDAFRPTPDRVANNITTEAVWPQPDQRAVGSAPYLDLNGDGLVNSADDIAGARQKFGLTDTVKDGNNKAYRYYKVSGYDVAEVPDKNGGKHTELRYSLFWTKFGLEGGSSQDDPRQLGYSDPPETTLITWNSFYRDYDGTGYTPQAGKLEIALFLGGAAKPYDPKTIFDRAWRAIP